MTYSATSAGTSGYVFDRDPGKYGGKQALYLSEVKQIVAYIAASYCKASREEKDLTQLFHETLAFLGQERQRIAGLHGTPNAQLFGVRRDYKDSFPGIGGITPLFDPYGEYNERLLPVLQDHLRGMDHTLKEFKQKESTVSTGKLGNSSSRLDINILSYEDKPQWAPEYSLEYYLKICNLCEVAPVEGPFDPNIMLPALYKNKDAMEKLKKKSIEDYKKIKIVPVLSHCHKTFEGRKSDWVLATVRVEIDRKMVALSQYVSWMNRDYKKDPVENMIQEKMVVEGMEIKKIMYCNSSMTILHQDPFLVDMTLNEIAKLFKQSIQCQHDDITKLSGTVAHLRYLYSHAMPFCRGSAATCEWLEQSLYLYHGYDIEYKKSILIDLEALTLPITDFVQSYPSMIKLTNDKG